MNSALKNYKATITDILNVSISHSIQFHRLGSINYLNTENIISNNLYNNIIKYINIKSVKLALN